MAYSVFLDPVRHVLSIFFGAAFTAAVLWAAGELLFRFLRISLHRGEQQLLAFCTGAPLVSFLVFALCVIHAAITPVFLALGILLILAALFIDASPARPAFPRLSLWWTVLLVLPLAGYGIVYLSNSFAPEMSPDGQTYHLGLVYRLYRDHGFERITTNLYASLSLGMEMLFLFAFSFGRHSASATLHCCFLFALSLLIFSYARRIGHSRAGVCAGALVFLSPVAAIDGVSAYNDVALATTAFALFYVLEVWRENQAPLLFPAGLLAGFCFAIKYTGFTAILYAAAVILIHRSPLRGRARALIPVASGAALIALPWLLKNWLWMANPVAPFANRIFPNPFIHVSFEQSYTSYFRDYGLTSLKPLFWIVTVTGELGGQIGPLFLLAPVALLRLNLRPVRHCAVAAAFFLISYPENIGARFLLPVISFAALGIAVALEFWPAVLPALVVAALVLAEPRVIALYRKPGNWQIEGEPWRAALRIIPQDTYLNQHSGAWISSQMLDYYVPPGKRVWSTTPVAEAYCKTSIMVNYQSAEGELIGDMFTQASHESLQPGLLKRFTFAARPVQHLRVTQHSAAAAAWSIGELHLFNGISELGTAKQWRLGASVFPWEIGLAFDGNPATRWSAWEPARPGMHIDIEFPGPRELDRVELHCSRDQGALDLTIESCNPAQTCSPLAAGLETLSDDRADLRRLATRAASTRGVDFLLVDDGNWLAGDMRGNPESWGLVYVTARGTNRLYRIE